MHFRLTDEQEAFAQSVRRFAREQLLVDAVARAHEARYPWDLARLLAKNNLLGITLREQDGGQGGLLTDAVVAIQEVALVSPKAADVVQAGSFGAIRTFAEYATPEQKGRFLPRLMSGDELLGLGMTESEAGSAVTDLRTTAHADGGDYVLNGSKIFSSHSPDATVFLVYVRYGPGVGGIGSVLVERDTPGLTIGAPHSYMSGEEWAELVFEDCRIPAGNVLLGPGGFKKQISGFNVERIGNAARSIALGRYAFNTAREHAKTREQFGKPLCEFQGLQWKFADMAIKLDSAQLLLHRAATNADDGMPSAYETSVAKAACNVTGFEVASEALQVMGGTGYSTDSLVEYCLRRTRGWMIAGGSVEILKNRIAESVFDRRFDQRA
ncbi:MAG: acyl-CoA dehydrogenase [Pseudonocardiaceae bacterium]|nr:acyl-CoA dehydrogenase [Pseudonocardiaceae bacterium]